MIDFNGIPIIENRMLPSRTYVFDKINRRFMFGNIYFAYFIFEKDFDKALDMCIKAGNAKVKSFVDNYKPRT